MSYETGNIRNVGLIGHGHSGKTSLTEAMLFDAKALDRLGKVEDGSTTTDYDEDEKKRQTSISSALAYCEWSKHKINILDTPGFGTFIADTRASLRAVDAAIIVVNAVAGVEVMTEKVWGFANEYDLPRLAFINRLDRERASFERCLVSMKDQLSKDITPIQIPLGEEEAFRGVIDLIKKKALVYQKDLSGNYKVEEIPVDFKDRVEQYRNTLMEKVAELDDALLEKYLESGELSEEEITSGLRKATQARQIIPVFCGSATNNIGVQPLLDAIVKWLPSPLEISPRVGVKPGTEEKITRKVDPGEPFSALVFKTVVDPFAGRVSMVRVCSGKLNADSQIYNSSKGERERVGVVAWLQGKKQKPVDSISAGDLAAIVKLNHTLTGDTLCDEKNAILYPPTEFPQGIISFAVEPKSRGDEEKISVALAKINQEDPALRYHRDPQTKELLVSGMGQLHVEVAIDKLKNRYGVEVDLKPPKVPYKETIKAKTQVQGKYKKQSGGRGQYGDTWLRLEPLQRGKGFEFGDEIVGGVVPKQYIPAVEKGLLEAIQTGILAGYPVTDLKITLYDGSYHDVDSSEMAFKIAASIGFKEGMKQCNPTLLEPIMNVEITAPEEYMGDLIGDLNGRRGRVLGMDSQGGTQHIRAQVPMAEMLKYAPALRSITGGRGDYTMEFSHYDEVPGHLQGKIIEEVKREKGTE
jgi:elongation factor G